MSRFLFLASESLLKQSIEIRKARVKKTGMANSTKCFQEAKRPAIGKANGFGNLEDTNNLQGSCFLTEERGAALKS